MKDILIHLLGFIVSILSGALGGLVVGIAISYILPPHQFPSWDMLRDPIMIFATLAAGYWGYYFFRQQQ